MLIQFGVCVCIYIYVYVCSYLGCSFFYCVVDYYVFELVSCLAVSFGVKDSVLKLFLLKTILGCPCSLSVYGSRRKVFRAIQKLGKGFS